MNSMIRLIMALALATVNEASGQYQLSSTISLEGGAGLYHGSCQCTVSQQGAGTRRVWGPFDVLVVNGALTATVELANFELLKPGTLEVWPLGGAFPAERVGEFWTTAAHGSRAESQFMAGPQLPSGHHLIEIDAMEFVSAPLFGTLTLQSGGGTSATLTTDPLGRTRDQPRRSGWPGDSVVQLEPPTSCGGPRAKYTRRRLGERLRTPQTRRSAGRIHDPAV